MSFACRSIDTHTHATKQKSLDFSRLFISSAAKVQQNTLKTFILCAILC